MILTNKRGSIRKEGDFGEAVRAHCSECDNSGQHCYLDAEYMLKDMSREDLPKGMRWTFEYSGTPSAITVKAFCPSCR